LAPGFPVWGSSITNGLCFLFYDDMNLKASCKIVWYPLKNKRLVSQRQRYTNNPLAHLGASCTLSSDLWNLDVTDISNASKIVATRRFLRVLVFSISCPSCYGASLWEGREFLEKVG
jgi:hypothetical protein